MKKGQIYEGKVVRLDFPNKGIVEVEGEEDKAIVKNSLPGQSVSFMINKKRKGKCEGRLLEVKEKAPYEIESVCPHFSDCGGCTYQNVPYEKQLELKKEQVRHILEPVLKKQMLLDENTGDLEEYIGSLYEGIKCSPVQFDYRNKMEFWFRRIDGSIINLHPAKTRIIIEMLLRY